jgi:hypothetical protein
MEPVVPFPRRDPSPFASEVVDVPRSVLWEAWVLAHEEAERAYSEWGDAPRRERGARFAGYRAALEREDRAAVVLRAAVGALDVAA